MRKRVVGNLKSAPPRLTWRGAMRIIVAENALDGENEFSHALLRHCILVPLLLLTC